MNGSSPYGAYDLAGNVWEWTQSWLLEYTPFHVLCGGSWENNVFNLILWLRSDFHSLGDSSYLGFRCARNL